MSHQTGIKPSEELAAFLASSKDGQYRVIKVIIDNEELVLADHKETNGTWEEDYDNCVLSMLEEKKACYIFYRMDTKDETGYRWLFISYIPDNCQVRQKMLYASTKATIKMSFGASQIQEELSGTLKSEVSLDGYGKHLVSKAAPGPLTDAEIEHKKVLEMETRTEIGVDTKSQTLPGLAFPVEEEALARIREIAKLSTTYVQLFIDMEAEVIRLARCEETSVADLPSRIPDDSPRYNLFVFPHTYEGDIYNSIVFIYTMPGYRCSVKERMLYSSCKAPFLHVMEQLGMEIATKIEIEDRKELTEDFLMSEVHPIRIVHKPKFQKPAGPAGRRGQSRVTGARDKAQ
ncbi:twinfilin-1-like [Diadema antillarum]|uniref:twinfilin-1-like n=1 Tax=Diadema antillarum TaxID=105358 RepID=UPI003A8C4982